MKVKNIRTEIIEELKFISEEELKKIYEIIHYFRIGVNSKKKETANIKLGDQFYGVWQGSESAEELISDIKKSRINRKKEVNL